MIAYCSATWQKHSTAIPYRIRTGLLHSLANLQTCLRAEVALSAHRVGEDKALGHSKSGVTLDHDKGCGCCASKSYKTTAACDVYRQGGLLYQTCVPAFRHSQGNMEMAKAARQFAKEGYG